MSENGCRKGHSTCRPQFLHLSNTVIAEAPAHLPMCAEVICKNPGEVVERVSHSDPPYPRTLGPQPSWLCRPFPSPDLPLISSVLGCLPLKELPVSGKPGSGTRGAEVLGAWLSLATLLHFRPSSSPSSAITNTLGRWAGSFSQPRRVQGLKPCPRRGQSSDPTLPLPLSHHTSLPHC